MANSFSKEERVQFENILEGFNDALTVSRQVAIYNTDQTMMARTGDTIWRPIPYIGRALDGMDQTANFSKAVTQLSVPSTIGFSKSDPWILDALEMRDALQATRITNAAKQKLASAINSAVTNVVAVQGTVVVKRAAAATGFDDIALVDAVFDETGVPNMERQIFLSPRDYNNMASNLAARQTLQGRPERAYDESYIGRVASFETFSTSPVRRLTAAAGGGSLTMSTLDGAVNYYIPRATSTAATGQVSNVDNRYQTITVSSTTSVAAGDAFTVAGINSVHMIEKGDTGQLKTFRVIEVLTGTTMVISPPLITNQVANDASELYQNSIAVSKSASAAITFLNTVTAPANLFWQKDAIELLPGRYAIPDNTGAAIMRGSTEQGLEVVMQKWYDIKTLKTFFRVDTLFGVTDLQPEMSGIMLFSQT